MERAGLFVRGGTGTMCSLRSAVPFGSITRVACRLVLQGELVKLCFSKFVAVFMTSTMASFCLVALPSPAAADTPRCVSRSEFQRVDFNDKKRRVHALFDRAGVRVENDAYGETRQYRTCAGRSRSYITVDYDFHRAPLVWFKWAYIENARTSTSNRCVTATEFTKVHKRMKKSRVHSIFDTVGRQARGGAGGYIQFYQVCKRPHRLVQIGYATRLGRPDRVFGKERVRNP